MIKRNKVAKTKQWDEEKEEGKERKQPNAKMHQIVVSWQRDEEMENTRCCFLVIGESHEDKLFGLTKGGRNGEKRIRSSLVDTGATLHPCKYKPTVNATLNKVHMICPWVLHFYNFIKLSCHKLCASIYHMIFVPSWCTLILVLRQE